jgi:hypothetical protein
MPVASSLFVTVKNRSPINAWGNATGFTTGFSDRAIGEVEVLPCQAESFTDLPASNEAERSRCSKAGGLTQRSDFGSHLGQSLPRCFGIFGTAP